MNSFETLHACQKQRNRWRNDSRVIDSVCVLFLLVAEEPLQFLQLQEYIQNINVPTSMDLRKTYNIGRFLLTYSPAMTQAILKKKKKPSKR